MSERGGNSSHRSLRPPNRRHFLTRVTQKSLRKRRNTVIEPWVDVRGDVEAINAGQAIRRGNTYTIHDRTYGVEPNGTLYPISGVGLIQLGQPAYSALGIYNSFGETARAEQILDRMGVSEADRTVAREVRRSGGES